jgi:hypothetical protein
MRVVCCKDCFGYGLLCLLPAVFVGIIIGAIYLDAFDFYEASSHHGLLIDSYVSINNGESTTYVVEQIFSYHVTTDGLLSSANCTRDVRSFYSQDKADRASDAVVLGTSRTIYLSKRTDDHSCIDKETRALYLQTGLYSLAFVAAYVFAVGYLAFGDSCKGCCLRSSVPAIFAHPYRRTGGAVERDDDSVLTDLDEEVGEDPGSNTAAAPVRRVRTVEVEMAPTSVTATATVGKAAAGAETGSVGSWASTADSLSDSEDEEEGGEDGEDGVHYV